MLSFKLLLGVTALWLQVSCNCLGKRGNKNVKERKLALAVFRKKKKYQPC